ncbi:MAG: hypothetical protein N2578_02400 [Bdellovibrionaceae bacterium]|nr:hypothetical protein [Pseudobdellovibrionaceae bacterium]
MNTVSHWISRLEKFLESPHSPKPSPLNDFEPCRDPLLVEGLSEALPQIFEDRSLAVFMRLAALFDSGAMLEKTPQGWSCVGLASFGEIHSPPQALQNIFIPEVKITQVLRKKVDLLSEQLLALPIPKPARGHALLFRPCDRISFLMFSGLADPWLKEHTEKVQHQLLNCFAEGE